MEIVHSVENSYALRQSILFDTLACVSNTASAIARCPDAACLLRVPDWAARLTGAAVDSKHFIHGEIQVEVTAGLRFSLVTARAVNAHRLDAAGFERITLEAYRAVALALKNLTTPHALRFWNFIPHIRTAAPGGLDRYMVFNAGRFAALTEWFGGKRPSSSHVATASGVGHAGSDLVIHVLAGRTAGRQVENPRQIPSFDYSRRYGPVPPCFARATWVDEGGKLLIGGTSSVCGEASVHPNDAAGQTRETLTNLSHLLAAAGVGRANGPGDLFALRDLRVYVVRMSDRPMIEASLREALGADATAGIEFVQADLCRPELLVEIEGLGS